MRARLKQLGKDSIVYGIGGIITKAIIFLLLPVYTRVFTPPEYGAIETLTMLNNFLIVLLIMGMDVAQSFYFFEQKKSGKMAQAHVVTAILQWRLIWGSAIVILATFLSPLFKTFFFDGKLTIVPGQWRALYGLNPMVGVIEGFRRALLGKGTVWGPSLAVSVLIVVLIFIGGIFYFRRMEKTFADVV